MSFGKHEYQHRFFRSTPHKKVALYTPQSNQILPPLSHEMISLPQSHILNDTQHLPLINNTSYLNPYLQSGRMRMVTDNPDVEEYQNNAAMLEYFKRQAEQKRKRVRLRRLQNQHFGTIKTEGSEPFADQSLQPVSLVFNPEAVQLSSELIHQAQLNNVKQQVRKLTLSRLQRQKIDSNVQLRNYKSKYHKLKKKLNDQLLEKIRQQKLQTIVREELLAEREKDQLSEIKKMMNNISDKLRKNSHLLEQSIRVREDLSFQMNQSAVKNETSGQERRFSTSEVFQGNLDSDDCQSPYSTPSVIYAKKSLDSQYKKMERLRNDINLLNFRLRHAKN